MSRWKQFAKAAGYWVAQCFDDEDPKGTAYDYKNRPLIFCARYAWQTFRGLSRFAQVDGTQGPLGGFIKLKPKSPRKLAQWSMGSVYARVTTASPLKVTPIMDCQGTPYTLADNLDEFEVTGPEDYTPQVDDEGIVLQGTELGSEELIFAPTKATGSSGSGVSTVEFSHTFSGSENYEADGSNQSMIYVCPVPITGEFFLWGCVAKITATLVGGPTVNSAVFAPGTPALPWSFSYLQIGDSDTGTSTPASPIFMNGFPSYIFATGGGDGVTFSGVNAGSFINGRGLEAINQIIFNGYKGGIPDSLGGSSQRHIWIALKDSIGQHADQIVSGEIHGRIYFWQTPTAPADLAP